MTLTRFITLLKFPNAYHSSSVLVQRGHLGCFPQSVQHELWRKVVWHALRSTQKCPISTNYILLSLSIFYAYIYHHKLTYFPPCLVFLKKFFLPLQKNVHTLSPPLVNIILARSQIFTYLKTLSYDINAV